MRASIGLKGLESTIRGLHNLGEQAQNRVVRNAARAGASTLSRALKKAAPRSSGAKSPASQRHGSLRKNIKVSQLRTRGKFLPYYRVSTSHAFWGGFIDEGTGRYNVDPGPRAKGAAARTHILPNFWWRNTIEQQRPAVTRAMIENIRRSLVREWAKVK